MNDTAPIIFFCFTLTLFSQLQLRILRLDLAAGQGCAARACLTERLPYFGFVLSETHARRLEVQLTEFILGEMRNEGSKHYRPEAVQSPEGATETGQESGEPAKGTKNKPKGDSKGQPKTKKPRKPKTTEDGQEENQEEEGQGEEQENSPLPW